MTKAGNTCPLRICEACGAYFHVHLYRADSARFCSRRCLQVGRGRVSAAKRHAHADLHTPYRKRGPERLHRLIAAAALGRPLAPGEVVHHVDGNKLNNNPENLQVMTAEAHALLHDSLNTRRKAG